MSNITKGGTVDKNPNGAPISSVPSNIDRDTTPGLVEEAEQATRATVLPIVADTGDQPEAAESLDEALIKQILADAAVGAFGYFPDTDRSGEQCYAVRVSEPIQEQHLRLNEDSYDNVVRMASYAALDIDFGGRNWVLYLNGAGFDCVRGHKPEAIGFQRMDTPVHEKQKKVIRNHDRSILDRFLGRNKTVEIECEVDTGERRIFKHSELIREGKDEQAYRIGVIFYGVGKAFKIDIAGRGCEYDVVIYLPKSTAEKLWARIDENPLFMRRVLEELFTRKLEEPIIVRNFSNAFLRTPGERRAMYIVPPHDVCKKSVESLSPEFFREV